VHAPPLHHHAKCTTSSTTINNRIAVRLGKEGDNDGVGEGDNDGVGGATGQEIL